MPRTPPKAETGSAARARRYASRTEAAGGRAAGIRVLDDDDSGFIKFRDELPACVKVDEIVVGELLALKLLGGGYPGI